MAEEKQWKPVEPIGWDYFTKGTAPEGHDEWFVVGEDPELIVDDAVLDWYVRHRVMPGQWRPIHCVRCGSPKRHGRLACWWKRLWQAMRDRRAE